MLTEVLDLIRENMARYPLSEPRDVIKLLYQREFGPGHAISDPEAAGAWLFSEYESCGREEGPALTRIGNGFARLDLKRLDSNGISPDRAAEWFVMSAVPTGDMEGFRALLSLLAADEEANSLVPGLCEYVSGYLALGCPAVHHSAAYNKAYSPAYRVIKEELAGLPSSK